MKSIPADRIKGMGDFLPEDDGDCEYYCACYHLKRGHDEDGCDMCAGECLEYIENPDNPVIEEDDPDRGRD